ncbi:hypothetical protein [Streptomyces sp. Tue6028]|uniref:hypothetical protein n=1 Tax=Streptomyces sp. Tue6028 TaxID=2036037 RepID=UPI003D74045E
MITSSWDRSRRRAAAAVGIVVTAIAASAVVFALGAGVPDAWWPHTGQAFTPAPSGTTHHDSSLLVGLGTACCASWKLVPAGWGVAALVVRQLRYVAGQRRR